MNEMATLMRLQEQEIDLLRRKVATLSAEVTRLDRALRAFMNKLPSPTVSQILRDTYPTRKEPPCSTDSTT